MHSQQQPGVGLFFHESAGKIKVYAFRGLSLVAVLLEQHRRVAWEILSETHTLIVMWLSCCCFGDCRWRLSCREARPNATVAFKLLTLCELRKKIRICSRYVVYIQTVWYLCISRNSASSKLFIWSVEVRASVLYVYMYIHLNLSAMDELKDHGWK